MANFRIIADSTCDLDPALILGDELEILPLTITIGEKNYLDGEEIGVSEVYDVMRAGTVPKTSQIPYGRTYDLIRSLFERGLDAVYIAFSSEMSGCYSVGEIVAQELSESFPDRKIAVIDSKGGSGATGLIVLQALKMVRAGLPFETVVSEVRFMADHVEHVFSVDDMEWLAKGGRIPKAVGFVGSKIDIHPILHVIKGRMAVLRMVLGKKKAIQAVADEIIRRASQFGSQLISITHGDDLR
jgi:DegV family protein with EDD domain